MLTHKREILSNSSTFGALFTLACLGACSNPSLYICAIVLTFFSQIMSLSPSDSEPDAGDAERSRSASSEDMVVVQHSDDLNQAMNAISAGRGVGFGWRSWTRTMVER